MPPRSKTGVRGLYRGSDGRYRIDMRWRDLATGEHRRFREQLPARTTATAAKARATKIMNLIVAGDFAPDAPASVTLRAAFDQYLEHCAAEAGAINKRTHAGAWCTMLGPSRPLASVSAVEIERAKAELGKEREAGTVNRYLTTWKSLVTWASSGGVAIIDKARAAELQSVKLLREPEGRVRWLSEDEERAIREDLTGWLRPIVLTAIGTGARRNEIAGLRWRDVDLEHREIILRKTKNRKTRHVPMNSEVRAIIKAQPDGGPDSFVFEVPLGPARSASPELRRRGRKVTEAWRSWCDARGFVDLRVHDLRHSAATAMRRAGHGLDVIGGVLGHSSLAMTARYAHIGRDELAAAVESIARPLPNESEPPPEGPKK